jgi:hypothetical protein
MNTIDQAMRKSLPPWGLSREAKFSRSVSVTVARVLELAKDGHYAGIDISPTMVEEARRFNAEFVTSGRAAFHCADVERMPSRTQCLIAPFRLA